MFDSESDNTKQMILLNYLRAKQTYELLLQKDSDLLSMVTELRNLEGLDEGIKLDYITNKIEQGISIDEYERNTVISTLALHSSTKFYDEKFGLVRVQ